MILSIGINKSNYQKYSGDTLYVGGSGPGNYTNIQAAIDAATDGDTVFVYDESSPYLENIYIYKTINLIGEDWNTTEIYNDWEDNYIIEISADFVKINGFTFNCDGYDDYDWGGIIIESSNNNITGNILKGYFEEGTGIKITKFSNNNTILKNLFTKNQDGLYIQGVGNNTIKNNIFSDNSYFGIELEQSYNNIIVNNTFSSNSYFGIEVSNSNNNYIYNNEFLTNEHDLSLRKSHNNAIFDNLFNKTDCCVCLALRESNYNTITGNNITPRSATGIELYDSKSNIIEENFINKGNGITFHDSDSNTILKNSFYFCGLNIDYNSNQNIISNNIVNNKPLIYKMNESDYTVNVEAGQIILFNCINFTIKNQELSNTSTGIKLLNSNNCSIFDNNISNCGSGIGLGRSNNNNIIHNYLTKNDYSISFGGSSNNLIMKNIIFSSNHLGLYFNNCNNNTINSNKILKNSWGLWLCYSNYTIIDNNEISNNGNGIDIDESKNNKIIGNNITNNSDGIQIQDDSKNNIVIKNNISFNREYGIICYDSNHNIIYHNNFKNNTKNAEIKQCYNTWDDRYPSGGNYWHDYKGEDKYRGIKQDILGSDGIGDTAYEISDFYKNEDNFPLIYNWGKNPPVANYTFQVDNYEAIFNGSTSYDRDGNVIYYEWDFDDNNTGIGKIINHTYQENGTFNVLLTVTDDKGFKGNWSQIVIIGNVPPYTPKIEGPNKGETGKEYEYNFFISDPNKDKMHLRVDWGSGTPSKWDGPFLSDSVIKYNYSWDNKGSYTIRAQTMDSNGLLSDWGTHEITIPRTRISIGWFHIFLEQFPILKRIIRFLIDIPI